MQKCKKCRVSRDNSFFRGCIKPVSTCSICRNGFNQYNKAKKLDLFFRENIQNYDIRPFDINFKKLYFDLSQYCKIADIKNNVYNSLTFIDFPHMKKLFLENLNFSTPEYPRLQCTFCKKEVYIHLCPTMLRFRLKNSKIGHSYENMIFSCYSCELSQPNSR